MSETQIRNIKFSNEIGEKLGLTLEDKEFNYGKGIGKADNFCEYKGWKIMFEIEYKQRHPEFNVSKVWPYLERNKKEKVMLIHYVTDSKQVSANRLIHSEWIANKMSRVLNGRFDYFLIKNEISDGDILELKNRLSRLK